MNALLPDGFAGLESFVPEFVATTAFARNAVRGLAPLERRSAFHAAFAPRLTDALDRLNQTPLTDHDQQERNLMLMALTYAHIAQSIEVQGPDEAKHTLARQRIPIVRATADR